MNMAEKGRVKQPKKKERGKICRVVEGVGGGRKKGMRRKKGPFSFFFLQMHVEWK